MALLSILFANSFIQAEPTIYTDTNFPSEDITADSDGIEFQISGEKAFGYTIGGTGAVTKTGAGNLTIDANRDGNSYTGGTTVSDGTLYLKGTNNLKSSVGTGDVTINSGAAIVAQSSNVFGSRAASNIPEKVIINGGSLTPDRNLHMNSLEINSGTVNSNGSTGDGLDFYDRNGTITSTGASSIASKITNRSTLTINVAENGTLSLTNNIDNIENSSNTTIKSGSGLLTTSGWINANVEVQQGTLQITGQYNNKSKRFNGEITIAKGALLDCATKDSLGYGSANTKINIYGTMDSTVDNETLNNTELHMYGGTAKATSGSTFDILNTGVKFYSYALTGATAAAPTVSTISPTLLLRHNGTLPIDTAANSQLNLTGEITGHFYNGSGYTDYNCSITKLGVGTLEITANNPNYFGTTTISAGTLVLSGAGTLGTGAVTVGENATLEIAYDNPNTSVNISSISMADGDVFNEGSAFKVPSGAVTFGTENVALNNLSGGSLGANGQIAVPATLTVTGKLTLNNDQLTKFIGSITAPTVEKTGLDTLQLCFDAQNGVDITSMIVSSGRMDLKGYMLGGIEVDKDAVFSPGNSVGDAKFGGGYELKEGATLLIEQDETGIDTLTASSFVIDDNSILELTMGSVQPGASYPIIFNTSPDGFQGDLATDNFWNGLLTPESANYWNLSVVNGNTVYASIDANAVPEPSTWALLILGAAGLLYVRKRTRK